MDAEPRPLLPGKKKKSFEFDVIKLEGWMKKCGSGG